MYTLEDVTEPSGVSSDKFDRRFTRMDADTPFEELLKNAAVVFFVAAVVSNFIAQLFTTIPIPLYLSVIATFLAIVRFFSDCTYVLDNEHRVIYYSTSFFGSDKTYEVCLFSKVSQLGVAIDIPKETIRRGFIPIYTPLSTIVMEIEGGVRFFVSKPDANFKRVNDYAKKLAEHLGCHYEPPAYEENEVYPSDPSSLHPNDKEIPLQESHIKWAHWSTRIQPGVNEIALLVAAIALLIIYGAAYL